MYNKSLDSSNWYSSSEQEPVAMVKNLPSSAILLLPQPSAILVGMEELERLICDIKPYISSFGKEVFVSKYIRKVIEWLFCQKDNCLKSFIHKYTNFKRFQTQYRN